MMQGNSRKIELGYLRIFLPLCMSLLWLCSTYNHAASRLQESYEWGVIGDGPSAIIIIGVLLSAGVPADQIVWCGRAFQVGRMGEFYAQVPANNKAKTLVNLLQMCKAFREIDSPAIQLLHSLDPETEYSLSYIINPLQDITDVFLTRVTGIKGQLTTLCYHDDFWELHAVPEGKEMIIMHAKRVVLAIGAHPRDLGYPVDHTIPLDTALNAALLKKLVTSEDTVAVVGDAHSAVLVLKFLSETEVGRVINFYKKDIILPPVENKGNRQCELHSEALAGVAARWAREVLLGNPPANLIRLKNCPHVRAAWLPICTKIIYAAGFERNSMPVIAGAPSLEHDPRSGILGPHLFGIGIGFPQLVDDGQGGCSYAIGLRDFMLFAQEMLPSWMKRPACLDEEIGENNITLYLL